MSLRKRSITGLLFGAAMTGGTLIHPLGYMLLYLLILVLALREFWAISAESTIRPWLRYFRIGSGLLMGLAFPLALFLSLEVSLDTKLLIDWWYFPVPSSLFTGGVFAGFLYVGLFTGLFLLGGFFIALIAELYGAAAHPFQHLAYLAASIFYLAFPAWMLLMLPPALTMSLLLLIWANDSFAYLFGRKIGKTPLFPRLSPKKTWEGTLSGMLGSIVAAFLAYFLFVNDWSLLAGTNLVLLIATALALSLVGTAGDLVESMLKRQIGIKDSGHFLPGHGGMLDRFDSFFLVVPFAFLLFSFYQLSGWG